MCVACAVAVLAPRSGKSAGEIFPSEASDWGASPAEAIPTRVTWTGVAGFVFDSAGTRIALDPFVSRPSLFSTLFRRARPDEAAVARSFPRLDAVFVGHTHFDHAMDLPAVLATSPKARLFGSPTTVKTCRRLGVDPARLEPVEDGKPVTCGPFRVEPVRAEHGLVPIVRHLDRVSLPREGVPRTPFRWPRGEVFAYRVKAPGATVHVQGSAGLVDASLARQAPCDVLVACLAARKGTPRYLERLCERLRPKVLVPCHHDDFFRPLGADPRPIATLDWPLFLEEAASLERAYGTRVVLPVLGRPVSL